MKRKKDKNIDNEALIRAKKERETVDRLVEEEKAAKKANKVKYGPGARSTAIIITSVSCFLLVLGGIFMINEMKKSDKYNSGNEVYTPAASSASTQQPLQSNRHKAIHQNPLSLKPPRKRTAAIIRYSFRKPLRLPRLPVTILLLSNLPKQRIPMMSFQLLIPMTTPSFPKKQQPQPMR